MPTDPTPCEYCGPVCYRGAEHNARVEDNARFDAAEPSPVAPGAQRAVNPWTIVDDWMQLFESLRYAAPDEEGLDDYQQGWNNALTVVLQRCRNRKLSGAPKVHACPECKSGLRLEETTWKCTGCPFAMPGRFA